MILKYTFWFSIILSTQLMIILMWGEYVWLFKYANGSVGGNPVDQINQIFWVFIAVECTLFLFLVLNKNNKIKC